MKNGLLYPIFTILTFAVFLVTAFSDKIYAKIPSHLEPDYAEAVISYNKKDYQASLKALESVELLELKALALKSSEKNVEAANLYKKLIKLKQTEKAKPEEIAPYTFELGVIEYRKKNYNEAKKYLDYAANHEFNEGAAHFFLGSMAFQAGNWSDAEEHFDEVLSSSAQDLYPVSNFYLGQAYIKMKQTSRATYQFLAAKNSSEDILGDQDSGKESKAIAEKINSATTKVLTPLDKSRFFGSASFLAGYDTNILMIPEESSSASGKSTGKSVIQGGIGYMSSPLRTYQFVPNLRTSINYNLNKDTQAGEYLSNFFNLYVTRMPLAPLHFGIKVQGSYLLQNSDTTKRFGLTPYSMGGGGGGFIKYELIDKLKMKVEAGYNIDKIPGDNIATDANKRSGSKIDTSVTFNYNQGSRFLNPALRVGYTIQTTKGTEYDSNNLSVGFIDNMNLTAKLTSMLGVDLGFINYPNRASGKRSDQSLTGRGSLTYKLTKNWNALGEFSYNKNSSNFPTQYNYKRYVFSVGINYTF